MILFLLLVSVMPLTRHPLWSAYVGELTVIKYLGVASLICAVFYLGQRHSAPQFFETPQSRWFAALMLASSAAFLALGESRTLGESPLLSYVSFLGLFFLTLVLVDSEERLRLVLLAAAASIAIASLYVLRGWQKMGFSGRPGWVTGDPNYYAISVLVILPLLYHLYRGSQHRFERLFCLACLGLTALAMTAAASRGGFLGFAAAVSFMIFRSRGRRTRMLWAAGMVLTLALISPVSPLERFLSPQRSEAQAELSRLALWTAGLQAAWDHPIIGLGPGNFATGVEMHAEELFHIYTTAHNTYIHILAEQGTIGLVLFLGVLIATFLSLGGVLRRTEPMRPSLIHEVAAGMQAALVGYAVSAAFLTASRQKFFWLLICLSMCLPPLERRAAKKRAAAVEVDRGKPCGVRSPLWP